MHLKQWQNVELNRSGRPTLHPEEVEILVGDDVGLYQGTAKVCKRQRGRVYLTTQRVIYIDRADPLYSVALRLVDVESMELHPGFMRSSPKVTLVLKLTEAGLSPLAVAIKLLWGCPICFFVNTWPEGLALPVNDTVTLLPPCLTCGVPPTARLIQRLVKERDEQAPVEGPVHTEAVACPQCTFHNHPSLVKCELCDAPLREIEPEMDARPLTVETETSDGLSATPGARLFVKVSFRNGGEHVFYERGVAALERLKWDTLVSSGRVNANAVKLGAPGLPPAVPMNLNRGISSLVELGERKQQETGLALTGALEDIDLLMHKATELLALSDRFAQTVKRSPGFVPLATRLAGAHITTGFSRKDLLTKELYDEELTRQLAEYLQIVLPLEGGIMSLVDLFALFNRTRGINLISPADLNRCCGTMLAKLNLPYSLKTYKSGTRVVMLKADQSGRIADRLTRYIQQRERSHYAALRNKLEVSSHQLLTKDLDNELAEMLAAGGQVFGGLSTLEISQHFKWSYGVADEELELARAQGALVIDQQISGTCYFVNKFGPEYDWEAEAAEFEVKRWTFEDYTVNRAASPLTKPSSPDSPSVSVPLGALHQLDGLLF